LAPACRALAYCCWRATASLLLSQNLIFIAAAVQVALWLRTRIVSCIAVIGLADGIGVNVGRIGGMLSPIFAALAATGLFQLEKLFSARAEARQFLEN